MIRVANIMIALSIFVWAAATLQAQDMEEGIVEKAGRSVDETIEATRETATEAKEQTGDTLARAQREAMIGLQEAKKAVGKAIKEAGSAVGHAAERTGEYISGETPPTPTPPTEADTYSRF